MLYLQSDILQTAAKIAKTKIGNFDESQSFLLMD